MEITVDKLSSSSRGNNLYPVKLTVNSKEYSLEIDPRSSLLDVLREHIGLTGTKKGCNQGACGACTVIAGSERINSCLALAAQYSGKAIKTIEGFETGDKLSKIQSAFICHDGFQCGYCTPGQICSVEAMLNEFQKGMPSAVSPYVSALVFELTDEEIKERMSGNICRCGAYNGIVDAIRDITENRIKNKTHETVHFHTAG